MRYNVLKSAAEKRTITDFCDTWVRYSPNPNNFRYFVNIMQRIDNDIGLTRKFGHLKTVTNQPLSLAWKVSLILNNELYLSQLKYYIEKDDPRGFMYHVNNTLHSMKPNNPEDYSAKGRWMFALMEIVMSVSNNFTGNEVFSTADLESYGGPIEIKYVEYEKEPEMKFENRVYINGKNAKEIDDEMLINLIGATETKIRDLALIETQSQTIQKRMTEMKEFIEKIVKYMDERNS